MIDYMQVALGFSTAAMLICATDLVYMHIHGHTDKTNNKFFIAMLYILLINAVCGIVSSVGDSEKLSDPRLYFVYKLFRYIYFVSHTALCPLLYFYVSSVVGMSIRENKKKTLIMSLPFFISEIFVLINPLVHQVYYFDEAGNFQRNWAEALIYLAAAIYYVLAVITMIRFWKVLDSRRKTMLMFCYFMALLGVFLQFLFKSLRVEVLFEAIGFTGAMMTIENEDDRVNATLGVYNRLAMMIDVEAALKNYNKLYFIVLRAASADTISHMTRSADVNLVYAKISEYLKTLVSRYSIYAVNPGVFLLVMFHKNEDEVMKVASQIDDRFTGLWDIGDMEFPMRAVVMVADSTKHISSLADISYMTDALLPKELDKTLLVNDDLDFLLRRAAVEGAVSRGLEEGSFEVYYQPTYHIDGTLHGAEALLRMHDKEIGNVFPDEFIPVAEQMGLIDDIDDFVLREVCQFVRTGIPKKNGMDSINVNLSVLQCMRSGFVEHINTIVEKEGVHKDFLNFEITESVAATDYKLLRRVVKELKKEGFLFSMDDYGTGYSNMNAIFSLNLDVIKIDKSILWGAEKSELGAIILENSIRMIRQMKKEILVEGVETEEQVELLRELGVDYLQGYYFSKPIPKNAFIELIEKAS